MKSKLVVIVSNFGLCSSISVVTIYLLHLEVIAACYWFIFTEIELQRNIDLLLSFQTCKPIFFDPDLMFLMLLSEDVIMLKFPFYLFIYLNFFIYGTKLCLAY